MCPQPTYKIGGKKFHEPDASEFGEDCLKANIWIPAGPSPPDGWPVYVWLHGGWLQMGNASQEDDMDPTELVSALEAGGSGLGAIFVAVAYRLSAFGFLAGQPLVEEAGGMGAGNYGMWDQRAALEWVNRSIAKFGGNPGRVTLSGRSAGAYSAHAQMFYEFFRAPPTPGGLFHNVILMSNAIPTQPKPLGTVQPQFDSLLAAFGISPSLSNVDQMKQLRAIPAIDIARKVMSLEVHTFRTITDDDFFLSDMFARYDDGSFAKEFKKRGMKILMGEVAQEEVLYRKANTPKDWEALKVEVGNYYKPDLTYRLIAEYRSNPSHQAAADPEPDPTVGELEQLYGLIISDGQVRAPARLLAAALRDGGVALADVLRYKISYRWSFFELAGGVPPQFGVTHGCDRPIWAFASPFYPFTAEERVLLCAWNKDVADLVQGMPLDYGTRRWEEVKELTPRGTIEFVADSRWADLQEVARVMSAA